MPWENRPKEIAQLDSQGRRALEHAEDFEPREFLVDCRPQLRLWHFPAFFAYMSWTLFADAIRPVAKRSPRALRLREVTWDRPHDMARFADPLEGVRQGFSAPPTIRIRDGELPRGEFAAWQREMARVPIPVIGIPGTVILDGEGFGFESYDVSLPVRLEWPDAGPLSWRQFTRGIDRLRQRLLDCLP